MKCYEIIIKLFIIGFFFITKHENNVEIFVRIKFLQ